MNIKRTAAAEAYQRGYKFIEKRCLVVAAMSIGNSYFSKEKIDELLPFWSSIFPIVRILIADLISVHTYKAKGYDEDKARKKTRLAGNRLKNHCLSTIQKMKAERKESNIIFVDWEKEVEHSTEYERHLSIIHKMYQENQKFREDAKKTTLDVLKEKIEEDANIDAAMEEGVNYLLEELAFLLASPVIFGVENVAYIYHREWPIYINLIDGKYDGKVRENLAFIQIED
ncbi:MAG: tRNA-dependent cyclodipeptide synthase [Nanoarchaeota archaeon]